MRVIPRKCRLDKPTENFLNDLVAETGQDRSKLIRERWQQRQSSPLIAQQIGGHGSSSAPFRLAVQSVSSVAGAAWPETRGARNGKALMRQTLIDSSVLLSYYLLSYYQQ